MSNNAVVKAQENNGRVITTIGSAVTLCLATVFGFKGLPAEMGIVVAAGAMCLAFLNK